MSGEQLQPVVIVIGGPNGAGKTTSAHRLLPEELHVRAFVNADVIASGLSAFDPEGAAVEAGRIMLTRLKELGAQRKDFSFETTLASRTFAPFLRGLRSEGYRVHLYYVRLRSPELSIERIRERVARGGHFVPDETVRRRYTRGHHNFLHLYRPIADSWVLCDNSGNELQVVATGSLTQVDAILDEELWDEVERAASER
jgi:predicted ABC-type ATPase